MNILLFVFAVGLLKCPGDLPIICSTEKGFDCYPENTSCECTQLGSGGTCEEIDEEGNRFQGICNMKLQCDASCPSTRCLKGDLSDGSCKSSCLISEIGVAFEGSEICFPPSGGGSQQFFNKKCLGLLSYFASDPQRQLSSEVQCKTGRYVSSYVECPCPSSHPLKCPSSTGYECIVGSSISDCQQIECFVSSPIGQFGYCNLLKGTCEVNTTSSLISVIKKPTTECPVGMVHCPELSLLGGPSCYVGHCSCQTDIRTSQMMLKSQSCRLFLCKDSNRQVSSPMACPCPKNLSKKCFTRDGFYCISEDESCKTEPCGYFGDRVCDFSSGQCVCRDGFTGHNCTEVLTSHRDYDPPITEYNPLRQSLTGEALVGIFRSHSTNVLPISEVPVIYNCMGTSALVTRLVDCPCPDDTPVRCVRHGIIDCYSSEVSCECSSLLSLDTSHSECDNTTCPDSSIATHPLDCSCSDVLYPKKCLSPFGYTCERSTAICPHQVPCLGGRGTCDLSNGICECNHGFGGINCFPGEKCSKYECSRHNGTEISPEKCDFYCPENHQPCTHDDGIVTCIPEGYECGCAYQRFILPINLFLQSNYTIQEEMLFDCIHYTGVAEYSTHPLECSCPLQKPKKCINDEGVHCVPSYEICPSADSMSHNCSKGCDLYQGTCNECDEVLTCNGNGHCTQQASTWPCECFEDNLRGHWDPQSNCSKCLSGWYGDVCNTKCETTKWCPAEDSKCIAGECECPFHTSGHLCQYCSPGYKGRNCTEEDQYVIVYIHSEDHIFNGLEYSFLINVNNEHPTGGKDLSESDVVIFVELPLSDYNVEWTIPSSCWFSTMNYSLYNTTTNSSSVVLCDPGNLSKQWNGLFSVVIPIKMRGSFIAWVRLVQPTENNFIYFGDDMTLNYEMYPTDPTEDQPRSAMHQSMPMIPDVDFYINMSTGAGLVDQNYTIRPVIVNNGPGWAVIHVEISFPDDFLAIKGFWNIPSSCEANSTRVVTCDVTLGPGETWLDNKIGIELQRIEPGRPDGWLTPDGLRITAIWYNHLHPNNQHSSNATMVVIEPYVRYDQISPTDIPRIGYQHYVVVNGTFVSQQGIPNLERISILVEITQPYTEQTIELDGSLVGNFDGVVTTWLCVHHQSLYSHRGNTNGSSLTPWKWKQPMEHRWVCTWNIDQGIAPGSHFDVTLSYYISSRHPSGVIQTDVLSSYPDVSFPNFLNSSSIFLSENIANPTGFIHITANIVRPGYVSRVFVNYTHESSFADDVRVEINFYGISISGGFENDLQEGCNYTMVNGSLSDYSFPTLSCLIGSVVKPGNEWGIWISLFKQYTSHGHSGIVAQTTMTNFDALKEANFFNELSIDSVIPDISIFVENVTQLHPGHLSTLRMNLSLPNEAIATDVNVNCTFNQFIRIYKIVRDDSFSGTDTANEVYSGLIRPVYPYPEQATRTEVPTETVTAGTESNTTESVIIMVSDNWDGSRILASEIRWDESPFFLFELLLSDEISEFNASCVVSSLQNPSGRVHNLFLDLTPAPDLVINLYFPAMEAWVMEPVTVFWNLTQYQEMDAYFSDVVLSFEIVAHDPSFLYLIEQLISDNEDVSCSLSLLTCKMPPQSGTWEKSGSITFLIAPSAKGDFYVKANVTSTPSSWISRGIFVSDYFTVPVNRPNAVIDLFPISPHIPGQDVLFQLNVSIDGKGVYHGTKIIIDSHNTGNLILETHDFNDFSQSENCSGIYLGRRNKIICEYPDVLLPYSWSHVMTTPSPVENEIPIVIDVELTSIAVDEDDLVPYDDKSSIEIWPHLPILEIITYNSSAHTKDSTTLFTLLISNSAHLLSSAQTVTAILSLNPGKDNYSESVWQSTDVGQTKGSRHLLEFDQSNPCEKINDQILNCSFGHISGKTHTNVTIPLYHGITSDFLCMNITVSSASFSSRSVSQAPSGHSLSFCDTLEEVSYEIYSPSITIGLRPAILVDSTMMHDTWLNTTREDSWFETRKVAAGNSYDIAVFLSNLPIKTSTAWGRYGYNTISINITIGPTDIVKGGPHLEANKLYNLPDVCLYSDSSNEIVVCEIWNNEANYTLLFKSDVYTGLREPLEITVESWGRGTNHLGVELETSNNRNDSSRFVVKKYQPYPPDCRIAVEYDDMTVLPGRRGTVYLNISNYGPSTAQLFVVGELIGNMRYADDFNLTGLYL